MRRNWFERSIPARFHFAALGEAAEGGREEEQQRARVYGRAGKEWLIMLCE